MTHLVACVLGCSSFFLLAFHIPARHSKSRRLKKAQSVNPPHDAFAKMGRAPREYVKDAVLKYEFSEFHVVQSHYSEQHPGGHAAALVVHVPDLRLTPEQHDIVVQVAGTRYNPSSKRLRLVSRKYLDKTHNRIHVRLMLDRLLQYAGAVEPSSAGQKQQASS